MSSGAVARGRASTAPDAAIRMASKPGCQPSRCRANRMARIIADAEASDQCATRTRVREKRSHYRKVVELPVEFSVVGDSDRSVGTCRNLSLGGVHIETETPAPFGARITVHLPLAGLGPEGLPGIVRWVKAPKMGVQFGLLGARETYAITRALAAES